MWWFTLTSDNGATRKFEVLVENTVRNGELSDEGIGWAADMWYGWRLGVFTGQDRIGTPLSHVPSEKSSGLNFCPPCPVPSRREEMEGRSEDEGKRSYLLQQRRFPSHCCFQLRHHIFQIQANIGSGGKYCASDKNPNFISGAMKWREEVTHFLILCCLDSIVFSFLYCISYGES